MFNIISNSFAEDTQLGEAISIITKDDQSKQMIVNMISGCICFIFYIGLNVIFYKLYVIIKKNRKK